MSFYDDSSNTIITVYSKADGPTEQGAASHVLIGYSSGQYCPFWSRAEKKSVERTYKARNLWTMSVTESQKKKKGPRHSTNPTSPNSQPQSILFLKNLYGELSY